MKEEQKINSVSDFIEVVVEKTMKAETREVYQTFWFRGEANKDWLTSLVPNSYRVLTNTINNGVDDLFISQQVKQIEKNMSSEFYRKATPFLNAKKIENSNWNRYFLMQHYKVNTRLLDWTENALLALFFAVSDNDELKNDAVVWILQPFKLNDFTIQQIVGGKHNFFIPHGLETKKSKNLINDKGQIRLNELTRRYLNMDFEKKEEENNEYLFYPLAIYPTYLDERISNQKGCFTIFGNKINGLKSAKEKNVEFLDKVIISGGKTKNKILKELRLMGIDFSSIYPDLDGIGNSIKLKYKQEFFDNTETLSHVLKELQKE